MIAVSVLALCAALPAHAQVIEIGDDGSARTYSKPTRFVTADATTSGVLAVAAHHVAAGDIYDRAARSHGLDVHLLRAVAWTESRGKPAAVSPKGALGAMQLMPATAAELGVDPLDPEANVSGGAAYLARQLSRFQSVPLALAAYNAGPGAVTRWGGIPPYAETQAYVSNIMRRWQGEVPAVARKVPVPALARSANPMLIEVPSL